jgi:hypothetical protein
MWTGHLKIKEIGATSKHVLIPAMIDQDARRPFVLAVPRAQVATLMRYLERAQRDLENHNGNGHSAAARERLDHARAFVTRVPAS